MNRPLIVQADGTVLLEIAHPLFEACQAELAKFAELVKSLDAFHTYQISKLTLWNAASNGIDGQYVVKWLKGSSKFGVPESLAQDILQYIGNYGKVQLTREKEGLVLTFSDETCAEQLMRETIVSQCMLGKKSELSLWIDPVHRGTIKRELALLGWPITDMAGYDKGEELQLELKARTPDGEPFALRTYQQEAVDRFFEDSVHGGSGVLVLPCGAGKTMIGIASIIRCGSAALILTTNITSVRQWKRELISKTSLPEDWIGEYTGERKEVKPITIATYQILTHRAAKTDPFHHMKLFHERDWGMIVYDEVHLLPAPVFRVTADLQAKRRLGLTATLIREDGRESDVFSLVGPKRYEASWKHLEQQGWLADVRCFELNVPLQKELQTEYLQSPVRQRAQIAATNPLKNGLVQQIVERHEGEGILIIGQYLDQLHAVANQLRVPLITGAVPQQERDMLYDSFRQGRLNVLVVSKVANFAVDLPDASVAIQISGSFGSRQEEAQRLGRILRPKKHRNRAYFYSIVTENSKEQDYARHRQLFLMEQGYRYRRMNSLEWKELKVIDEN
ncbi:DNA repair helicase XPB [Marinicrinis lubricantis]|uniref:DNA 3'-5' helicase n=1 Tax=Marinicrinis lubricantis TaxID=2086470 RepID=A0ABW1IMQ1_9BACL